jgi:hypothetical protein
VLDLSKTLSSGPWSRVDGSPHWVAGAVMAQQQGQLEDQHALRQALLQSTTHRLRAATL